jgi:hypothetical protein
MYPDGGRLVVLLQTDQACGCGYTQSTPKGTPFVNVQIERPESVTFAHEWRTSRARDTELRQVGDWPIQDTLSPPAPKAKPAKAATP